MALTPYSLPVEFGQGGKLIARKDRHENALNERLFALEEGIEAAKANVKPIYSLDRATTANVTLSGEQTIDGGMTSASKVLVWTNTDKKQNGPYLTGAGAWTRLPDFDTGAELFAQQFFINAGTDNGDLYFGLQNPVVPTVGATDLIFAVVKRPDTAKPGALDALRAQSGAIASAAVMDIYAGTGDLVPVTGSITPEDFGDAPAGVERTILSLDGFPLLPTPNILTPGNAPRRLMAGDSVIVKSLGSGVSQIVSGLIGQAIPVDASETIPGKQYDSFGLRINQGIEVDGPGREIHRGGFIVHPRNETKPGQYYDKFWLRKDYKTGPVGAAASASVVLPVATDGRTMHRLRAKLAGSLFPIGAPTGITRLILCGDSWADQNRIMQQLKDLAVAKYGESGFGFIAVDSDIAGSRLNGLTFSKSGWTYYDATEDGAPVAGIGCGDDGKAIYTTGTTADLSLSVKTEKLEIAYRDTAGGKFRYRTDAGAYTTVTGGGVGDVKFATISGLSDAVHTFDIDTTVNTGGTTAGILGLIATRSAPGIEFSKMGNGSLDGSHVATFAGQMGPIFNRIQPDAAIVILGTNDYRRNNSFATYTAAVQSFVGAFRAAVPDVSVALWAPADSNGSVVVPLIDYVAELHRLSGSTALNCEFFNNHALFGSFAQANALGQWFDNLHQSNLGGHNSSREFGRRFLGL